MEWSQVESVLINEAVTYSDVYYYVAISILGLDEVLLPVVELVPVRKVTRQVYFLGCRTEQKHL